MSEQTAVLKADFKKTYDDRFDRIETDLNEIKPLTAKFESFLKRWDKFAKAGEWSRRRVEAALLILVGDWAHWWWTTHGHSLFDKLVTNLTR